MLIFTENVGFSGFFRFFSFFRFVTKQFCLFRLFRYRFETPKQTEIFCIWFHETNRNKRETDLVSDCFGSNRNLFLFVSRTPYSQGSISHHRYSYFTSYCVWNAINYSVHVLYRLQVKCRHLKKIYM